YKHSLEASSQGSMPVISKEDIATIFSNIEDIYDIHNEFVQSLTPKVQKWTHSEAIGDIFKIM
ncbi:breakpoint cluster region protein, partial [Biomphalaria glabrata]